MKCKLRDIVKWHDDVSGERYGKVIGKYKLDETVFTTEKDKVFYRVQPFSKTERCQDVEESQIRKVWREVE